MIFCSTPYLTSNATEWILVLKIKPDSCRGFGLALT
jgi:hypothetical protein